MPLTHAEVPLLAVATLCLFASAGCDGSTAPPARAATVTTRCPEAVVSVGATPLAYATADGTRVARLDLDRDGRDEVAFASDAGVVTLQVAPDGTVAERWRAIAPGGATAMTSGDVDGDGVDDLIVGWGRSRAHPQVGATLTAYLSRGAAPTGLRPVPIDVPVTTRPEFTHLSVGGLDATGVLYALFTSKYDVETRYAIFAGGEAGTWRQKTIAKLRMGAHWAALPPRDGVEATLVVGRPYGDAQKAPGDVFELTPTGARRPLPAVRGVRSMAAIAFDNAGVRRHLVCYGAGWHWRYREQAHALLTCAERLAGGRWVAAIVDELGSFEVSAIGAGDLDGDGSRELLAAEPDGLYAYTPTFIGPGLSHTTWKRYTLGGGGAPFVAADIDGDGREEIITGGPNPMLYALQRPRAPAPR